MEDTNSTPENGRNPLVLIAGLAILGFAVALLIFGGTIFGTTDEATSNLEQIPDFSQQADSAIVELPTDGGPLAVGDTAYNFTIADIDGNPVQLSDYIGQPLMINFWATWCAPCRIEMPEFQSAFEEFGDEGLLILAVNQAETAEQVNEFFAEFDLTFTPLLDQEGLAANLYGSFNLPTTYFVNAEGEVTAIHRGPMVREQLDGYLEQTIPDLVTLADE